MQEPTVEPPSSSEVGLRKFAAGWCVVPLLGVFAAFICSVFAPALDRWLLPWIGHLELLPWAKQYVRPERLEQLSYLLCTVLLPLAIWRSSVWIGRWSSKAQKLPSSIGLLAILLQGAAASMTCWVLRSSWSPAWVPTIYDFEPLAWLISGIWILSNRRVRTSFSHLLPQLSRSKLVLWLFGPCLSGLLVIGLIFHQAQWTVFPNLPLEQIPSKLGHWYFHMTFTLGEFAAALGGKTPFVDFFPQYCNLLPLLASPLFRVFELDIHGFTLLLALLSSLGLFGLYRTCINVTEDRWLAVLLVLPILGASFWPLVPMTPIHRSSAFTYYAVGPLRWFFPWITCYLLSRYLACPTRRRLITAATVGSLALLNNLDWGAPVFIATLITILLCAEVDPHSSRARTALSNLAIVLTIFIFIAGLAFAGLYMRSGSFPDLRATTEYTHIFAVEGFFMMPIPEGSFFYIEYFVLLASFFTGCLMSAATSRRRVLKGLLIFCGVFGALSCSYYVGRSHQEVMTTTLTSFGMSLSLFFYIVLVEIKNNVQTARQLHALLFAFPGLVLATGVVVLSAAALATPSITVRSRELSTIGTTDFRWSELVKKIEEITAPDEPICLLIQNADLISIRAHRKNICPYAGPISLIAQVQMNRVQSAILHHGATKVFLYEPGDDDVRSVHQDIEQALTEIGLSRVRTVHTGIQLWSSRTGPH